MYKVKFTPYRKNIGRIFYRQTRGGNLLSLDGRYRFYIDEEVEEPDFWIVQGKGARKAETCRVAPENTILLSTEPESVLRFPRQYTRQFGMVHTSQLCVHHPHVVLGPPVLPWFFGFRKNGEGKYQFSLDYDRLKNSPTPQKTKLISVISSDKAFTEGHLQRIAFVSKLKLYYGDALDVFGRGINDFDDKWDVLSQYKYHIVIENSSEPYYWTEKIGDCFLAETFPFYYGCTNLKDYFPESAFQTIDINNFEETVRIIDNAIAEERYEQSKSALNEAKELMLDEFNMFEYMARLCDGLDASLPKKETTIRPCNSMLDWKNAWNYLVGRHIYESRLKGIQKKVLPEYFDEMGEVVYDKRNTIKTVCSPFRSVAIKRFRKADPYKSIVYSFFRKSKAERAFLNAQELTKRGISTPQPIQYLDVKKCGLFHQGYYVSEVTNDNPLKPLLNDADEFDEELATHFARFAAQLHQKGILHHDLNSTNTLYRKDQDGTYHFSLIDINRMDFYDENKEIPLGKCIDNLTRFTGRMPLFEFVAREYARERHLDEEDFCRKAVSAKTKHDEQWKRRKSFWKHFKRK